MMPFEDPVSIFGLLRQKRKKVTRQDFFSENKILLELKNRIANFKVPKRVFFAIELPRNTMKVQKNILRDRYRAQVRGQDSTT